MSVERLFHWKCDGCSREEIQSPHGLPKGWIWEQKGGPVRHLCPRCIDALPPARPVLRLVLEATGSTYEDLMAVVKETGKDIKARYTTNVGGKLGGAYVFRITKSETHDSGGKESSPPPPTDPQNGQHASLPCMHNDDNLHPADQPLVGKAEVAQQFGAGAGDGSPPGLADLAPGGMGDLQAELPALLSAPNDISDAQKETPED